MKKYKNISQYTIFGLAKPGEEFTADEKTAKSVAHFIAEVEAPAIEEVKPKRARRKKAVAPAEEG